MSLNVLVDRAVNRNLPGERFIAFFKSLEKLTRIEKDDYIKNLVELKYDFAKEKKSKKRLELCLALAFSSVKELGRFFECMSKTSLEDQLQYLISLNNIFTQRRQGYHISKEVLISMVNDEFFNYTVDLFSTVNSVPLLSRAYILLLTQCSILFILIVRDRTMVHDKRKFNELASIITNSLSAHGLRDLFIYFASNTKNLRSIMGLEGTNAGSIPTSIKNSEKVGSTHYNARSLSFVNNKSRSFLECDKIKRYLWVNSAIKKWQFNRESFFDDLRKVFWPQSFLASKDLHRFFELLRFFFEGFVISKVSQESPHILYNWKNFIITRLPLLLKELGLDTEQISERNTWQSAKDIIQEVFESLGEKTLSVIVEPREDSETIHDLRKEFVIGCIAQDLLPSSSYIFLFPNDGNKDFLSCTESSKSLLLGSILEEFRSRLIDVDCEFTTLEESALVDFVNYLPDRLKYLAIVQKEVTKKINEMVNVFTAENNFQKLYRLLLAISNNIEVVNLIAFNTEEGPYYLLLTLTNCIDTSSFSDESENNFQDTYAYFGATLLFIVFTLKNFQIDYSTLYLENSYTFSYIKNYYYRNCDSLPERLPSNSVTDENYDTTVSNWISALYDINNEGLSDDLIRSVNAKEFYKLIPNIYIQSIVATTNGKLDYKLLRNGLEYLSQSFLIPCSLNVLQWLHVLIWNSSSTLEVFLTDVLQEVVKIGFAEMENSNSESSLLYLLIFKITGDSLVHKLENLPNGTISTNLGELIEKLSTKLMHTEKYRPSLPKNSSSSICEEFRKILIQTFENKNKNYKMMELYLSLVKEDELILMFLEEMCTHMKLGYYSDNSKAFINIAIYLLIIKSISSPKEKQFWCTMLSSSQSEPHAELIEGKPSKAHLPEDLSSSFSNDKFNELSSHSTPLRSAATFYTWEPITGVSRKFLKKFYDMKANLNHEDHYYKPLMFLSEKIKQEVENYIIT